jgi:hypothetical protein
MPAGKQKHQRQVPSERNQFPRAGQHVRIDGRDEVFVILRVDKTRHLADLLRQGSVRKVESGIPLALLCVVPHESLLEGSDPDLDFYPDLDLDLSERAS